MISNLAGVGVLLGDPRPRRAEARVKNKSRSTVRRRCGAVQRGEARASAEHRRDRARRARASSCRCSRRSSARAATRPRSSEDVHGPMPPRSSGSAGPTSTCCAPLRSHRIPIVGVTEGESLPYVLDTNLVGSAPAAGSRSARSRRRSPACSGRPAPGSPRRLPVLRERGRRRADQRDRAPERPGRRRHVGARHRPADPDAQPAPARLRDRDRRAAGARRRGLCRSCSAVAGAAYGWRRVARALERLPVPAVVVRSGVAFAGTLAVGAAVRRRLA